MPREQINNKATKKKKENINEKKKTITMHQWPKVHERIMTYAKENYPTLDHSRHTF